jgi:hypothetical protein
MYTNCEGRVKTEAANIFMEYRNANHCHPANPEQVTVRSAVTKMKKRASTEPTALSNVYQAETANVAAKPAAAAAMPTFVEVRLIYVRFTLVNVETDELYRRC